MPDYTRVKWFSRLDRLIQLGYACDTDCIGITVASAPGKFSGFCFSNIFFLSLILNENEITLEYDCMGVAHSSNSGSES